MKKVLFLSTGNSCRSQIAEAIVNHRYKGKLFAVSAGVDPVPIHENTYKVMREIGLDISNHTINCPEEFKDENFDYIITLCDEAREKCPVFWTQGEAIYQHISIFGPDQSGSADSSIEAFRATRDEIEDRLTEFFDRELGLRGNS